MEESLIKIQGTGSRHTDHTKHAPATNRRARNLMTTSITSISDPMALFISSSSPFVYNISDLMIHLQGSGLVDMVAISVDISLLRDHKVRLDWHGYYKHIDTYFPDWKRDSSINCGICLASIPSTSWVHSPGCKHTFCDTCLYDWLTLHCTRPTCPTCRFDVREHTSKRQKEKESEREDIKRQLRVKATIKARKQEERKIKKINGTRARRKKVNRSRRRQQKKMKATKVRKVRTSEPRRRSAR